MVWKELESHRVDRSCSVAASRKFYHYDKKEDNPLEVDSNAATDVEQHSNLIQYVGNNIIGNGTSFSSPFGSRKVVYCDYIASGRSLSFLEDYICNEVLVHYGSTHTTATNTALQTTMFRHEARDVIRSAVRASEGDRVLLTGSGATGAVVRLLHGLCLQRPPVVLVGPFLHHSALLPWREAGAKVIRIREAADGSVDLNHLEQVLQQEGQPETVSSNSRSGEERGCQESPVQVIGCFSAASNVTGVLTDTVVVTVLLHRYRALAFWDYATAAPYVEVDMNPVVVGDTKGLTHKDAIFFSMHKFIGGPQTPGVLVVKRSLFRHPVPALAGGGSVFFVSRAQHRFLQEDEQREEGGTPDIVGTIRAGLVMQLKMTITAECIAAINDHRIRRLAEFVSSTPNLVSLGPSFSPGIFSGLGKRTSQRLPILSFLVRHPPTGLFLHHNFVSALLNDVYGVQARGGCACAGPYALDLLGISEQLANQYHQALAEPSGLDRHHLRRRTEHSDSELLRPGFVRLNLSYTASDEQVEFILRAVAGVCQDGWRLLPQYSCDAETAEWRHRRQPVLKGRQWLGNVSYAEGRFSLRDSSRGPELPAPGYENCLLQAEELFAQAVKSVRQSPDTSADQLVLPEASQHLRWFVLSSEARQLIVSPDTAVRHGPVQDSAILSAPQSGCQCANSGKVAYGGFSHHIDTKALSAQENNNSTSQGDRLDLNSDDSIRYPICKVCLSRDMGINNEIKARSNLAKCFAESRAPFCPLTYPLTSQELQSRPDHVWQQEPRLHYWPSASVKIGQHPTEEGRGSVHSLNDGENCANTCVANMHTGVDKVTVHSEGGRVKMPSNDDTSNLLCENDNAIVRCDDDVGSRFSTNNMASVLCKGDVQSVKCRDDETSSSRKGDETIMTKSGDGLNFNSIRDKASLPINSNKGSEVFRGTIANLLDKVNNEHANDLLRNILNSKYPDLKKHPDFLHSLRIALEDVSVSLDETKSDGEAYHGRVSNTVHQKLTSAQQDRINVLCDKPEIFSQERNEKTKTISVSLMPRAKEQGSDAQFNAVQANSNHATDVKSLYFDSSNTSTRSINNGIDSGCNGKSNNERKSSVLVSISAESSNSQTSASYLVESSSPATVKDPTYAPDLKAGDAPDLKAVCSDLSCFLPRPSTGPTLPQQAKARWQAPTKNIFAPMVEAISQFSMIRDGDRVLVCLSGGKDSLSLLHLLHQYQFYSRSRGVIFTLGAVTVDPESAAYDPRPLIPYLASLGVHYLYEQQGILQQALELADLNSICSFCSRMKRGRLYAAARRHRYNVLAFGQHLDDLAESFLMSVLHNGRLRTMKAAYTVSEGDLRVVRPLVFVREKHLRHFAESRKLPVIPENCPACFEVPKERHRSKQVLAQQELRFPQVYHSLRTALLPLMAISATGLENILLGKKGVLANALNMKGLDAPLGKQEVVAKASNSQKQDAERRKQLVLANASNSMKLDADLGIQEVIAKASNSQKQDADLENQGVLAKAPSSPNQNADLGK